MARSKFIRSVRRNATQRLHLLTNKRTKKIRYRLNQFVVSHSKRVLWHEKYRLRRKRLPRRLSHDPRKTPDVGYKNIQRGKKRHANTSCRVPSRFPSFFSTRVAYSGVMRVKKGARLRHAKLRGRDSSYAQRHQPTYGTLRWKNVPRHSHNTNSRSWRQPVFIFSWRVFRIWIFLGVFIFIVCCSRYGAYTYLLTSNLGRPTRYRTKCCGITPGIKTPTLQTIICRLFHAQCAIKRYA